MFQLFFGIDELQIKSMSKRETDTQFFIFLSEIYIALNSDFTIKISVTQFNFF